MINGINANRVAQQVAQLYSQRGQAADNRAGSVSNCHRPHATQRDEVQLSPEARSLQALAAAVADASEVDQARVSAYRQQIEAGTYKVPTAALADKLLSRLSDHQT